MLNIGENSSKYVKVWDVKTENGVVKGDVSSSKKNQNGEYENSKWFPAFFGKSKEKALSLNKGDTIEITQGGFSNTYNKEKKVTYYNMVIFDFEVMTQGGATTKAVSTKPEVAEEDDDDSLPF